MWSARAPALSACVLGWALLASGARAQGGEAPVSVSVDPCVPVDHAALHRLLAIELGTSTAREPGPKVPTRVWVSCSPLGIELRLADGMTSKMMARTLPASSFRDASSTRLLALAIAEFVVASWIELGVQPEPSVPPVPVAPPPSPEIKAVVQKKVAQHTRPPEEGVSVSGALLLSLWTANDSVWLGGGVRVTRLASTSFAWSVALDLTGTSADVELGRVRGLAGSLAFGALIYLPLPPLTLLTGPGARVGVARLSGQSEAEDTEGKHFAAPFGGPVWLLRADLRFGPNVHAGLELEAGVTTLPAKATAEGESVFALQGVWLSPALTLGASF